jgi:alkanesulfonate monooxygenase SsuD/methylene tetrahydromethanopterin reductase-like flavin-dependent oxidoreductase (luciferase family)
MDIGLFMMPGHPPERDVYAGIEWDLEQLSRADELGFTEAWIGEHFTVGWEPCPAPDLVIAQALRQTKRIRLAPGAHLLPYHHPAELAHRVAFLDHLAQGRYMLGAGAGAYMSDAKLFGVDIAAGENREMFREALDIMVRIWEADGPFEYQGKYWKCSYPEYDELMAGPTLKPFQKPYPPIGITGLSPGSSTLAVGGQYGFLPVSLYLNPRQLASHWTAYSEASEAAGRVPDRKDWRVAREFFVAETDEEARRLARDGMLGRANRDFVLPSFKRWGFVEHLKNDPNMHDDEVTIDYLIDNVWLVGSPDTVVEKILEQHETSGGAGTLLGFTWDYLENPEAWHQSMDLMATEVQPRIKHLVPSGVDDAAPDRPQMVS